MKNRDLALFDANNYYANSQKIFRPDLKNQPVIVLSNCDGAIVSRSNEAKALGFQMGEPFFKCRDLVRKHKVHVFSSNYVLYADISNRMMNVIGSFVPVQQISSIDECYVDFTGCHDTTERARAIRKAVLQQVHIPISGGIGSSHTLCKLASLVAKKHPKSSGVFNFNLLNARQTDSVLRAVQVEDVWGIGRQRNKQLTSLGINTAIQLRDADLSFMRSRFGITMEKTIRELRGESCIPIEEIAQKRKQIVNSRSFGKATSNIADLEDALAHFISNAALKLRNQNSVAGMLQVFITTDLFREDQPQHTPSIAIPLVHPTAHTPTLHNWVIEGLKAMYREGYLYRKAGVILSEISDDTLFQGDLFSAPASPTDSNIMKVLDGINAKYGRGTLKLSQDCANHNWAMKQDHKSPNYTTDIPDFPVCR